MTNPRIKVLEVAPTSIDVVVRRNGDGTPELFFYNG